MGKSCRRSVREADAEAAMNCSSAAARGSRRSSSSHAEGAVARFSAARSLLVSGWLPRARRAACAAARASEPNSWSASSNTTACSESLSMRASATCCDSTEIGRTSRGDATRPSWRLLPLIPPLPRPRLALGPDGEPLPRPRVWGSCTPLILAAASNNSCKVCGVPTSRGEPSS
eukprot:scaffold187038_cov29-Tisochrysis_lutea.AAC.5